MSWKSNLSWENAQKRAKIIYKVRSFFQERDVIEVETPQLSNGTITDVYLEAFHCRFDFFNSIDKVENSVLFLQTSPEFSMKRLLASGYGSIYQISKAFRHEEAGRYHNPEFMMLEWYRLNFNHHQLMAEVEELLKLILNTSKCEKFTYQHIFQKYLCLDPLEANIDELKQAMFRNKISGDWIVQEKDKDILLQVLFSECIEKVIGQKRPCFIYDFPVNQAALAQVSDTDFRVAQRFECYFKGVELVNGFNELRDAKEQIARFEQDNIKRKSLGKITKPIDKNFITALKSGLPLCSGVALGIDRLVMLALDVPTIKEVMSFSINDA